MYGPVFSTATIAAAAPMYPHAGPPMGVQPSFATVYRRLPEFRAPQYWLPDTLGSSDFPWLTELGPMFVTVQRNGIVWPLQKLFGASDIFAPPTPKSSSVTLGPGQLTALGTSFTTVVNILTVPTATFVLSSRLVVQVIPAPVSVSDIL